MYLAKKPSDESAKRLLYLNDFVDCKKDILEAVTLQDENRFFFFFFLFFFFTHLYSDSVLHHVAKTSQTLLVEDISLDTSCLVVS